MSIGGLQEQTGGEDEVVVNGAGPLAFSPTRGSGAEAAATAAIAAATVKEVSHLVVQSYPPVHHLGVGVRNWWIEVVQEIGYDLMYVGFWLLTPFVGGLEHRTEGTKCPVVIVPGFCGRPRSFLSMRDRISEAGHPVYVFESGWNWGCIVQKSRQLSDFLAGLSLPPEGCIVIGHSMGGLVACSAMLRGEPRIQRLIAVGVPFHGSYFALAGLVLFMLLAMSYFDATGAVIFLSILVSIPSARQMLPGSDLLRSLSDNYDRIVDRTTVIYSSGDQILFDRTSAFPTKKAAQAAIECARIGHAYLAFGESGIDLVLEEVRKP